METRMKDKHGKPLKEGDKVKVFCNEKAIYLGRVLKDEEIIFEVAYEAPCWYYVQERPEAEWIRGTTFQGRKDMKGKSKTFWVQIMWYTADKYHGCELLDKVVV